MRMIVVKLPDDVYRELEEKARKEGYSLVSDYVKNLILRELGRAGVSLEAIEERLSRLESGDLPQPLYERIGSIVRSILQEEGVSSIDVERLLSRLERKIHDMINPWTAKVDRLAQQVAELNERLEALEEEVKKLKEEAAKQREHIRSHGEAAQHIAAHGGVGGRVEVARRHASYHGVHGEGEEIRHRRRRRTAIEWLKEQGVLFESELMRLRDRDAFFEKLRREGAIVIELPNERVAVDREFWERFKERIQGLPTVREDEIRALLDEPMFKLFQRLKEAGLIYFDASEGAWKVSREIEG
ncbi:hypothetical protein Pyrfu_0848 [Pyrolobus fumarii 1A]|uniref:CopG domain protein DNA-binding domain protein n=1 Tax=Pyrolobus fumarii (strain DSM 11204 / 1A) TaxID=694429 RepID=G0EDU8_PYRF1|nr:hypothetical protein [Pyrolobus fumarii]AEM38717.1 hypothetical protein Pyrfu_0848 [Pyrolobus fumarii 1A]